MPELPGPKGHTHPYKQQSADPADEEKLVYAPSPIGYVELAVTSNFTFLTGASHPDEFVSQAAGLGYRAIAIADHNTLAGVVRGHVAAKEIGIPYIVGSRLRFRDAEWISLLVYPTDRAAYGRLCRLLTTGKRRAEKGECHLNLDDLGPFAEGLLGVALFAPGAEEVAAEKALRDLFELFDDDRLSVGMTRLYQPDDHEQIRRTVRLAQAAKVPLVAVNDAYYHVPQRRIVQDTLGCIRHGCTLAEAGFRLFPNAERYLKPPEEMARLFGAWPAAVARTVEIAERAQGFSLEQLRYEYPHEVCPPGKTPMEHMCDLTWQGAAGRYPGGVPDKVRRQIEHEFSLIEELQYAPYFLTVHDLVRYARSRGILCQGRGAAANSAVCYCLGVTSVDPDRIDVLFERFVSKERCEPPDIDIDFEHERREEVIQYIYGKYGRDRAGLTAEVISYRGRSAIRDVGKALGLSLDAVDKIAKHVNEWTGDPLCGEKMRSLGFEPTDPMLLRFFYVVGEVIGFPRHLSQHVGGFVMARGPLCEYVPIENAAMPDRTVIEWDKDDIDAVGMLKVDVLGLGMLTCISKALSFVNRHAVVPCELHTIPAEDPAVYDMICKADTIGVFQIESRAQMTMLPRLKPRNFYDLVIEVAIVRPGPIVGDMVHPFLRRRNKEEPVNYPDEKVEKVLGKTLGIPLFQEQAMSLAISCAGFTAGEAEKLRRTINAWKARNKNAIPRYQKRFVDGMVGNGYEQAFAEQCFERLKGFSEYGFPESHAASFALLVYASAWLKCYYPAAFAAALINSQPMGFYAPAQIVRDARDHGVEVRPIDVNCSEWDCTLENRGRALRLGMRLVKGLREAEARLIEEAVKRRGRFFSVVDLWRASEVQGRSLHALAAADAFGSMGLDRRHALWAVQALHGRPMPLFDSPWREEEADHQTTALPPASMPGEVVRDYRTVGLSLKAHPVSFIREQLRE
ncbi:MAG TPA: error-prone DNA polymerase, partial [Phycisphaerae bacterium]|nr:error-prone DNA polymerase [Phycisphaerae bacterium]